MISNVIKSKVLIPFTLILFILIGCNGGTDENKSTSDAEEDSETLHLSSTGELPTLRTNGEIDGQSHTMMQNIFEGLYRKGKDDEPTNGIAEDYDKDEDENIYTFYLREDAEWSNGDSVTADDFIYAWKKALHPDTFSSFAYLMEPIENVSEITNPDDEMYGEVDELGAKAIDDKTLELKLENDVPYLFELLAHPVFFPQNEKFVEEQGDDYALEADNLVFNGPYTMTEWDHDQNWLLEKNQDYWDASTVKTEKINIQVVKDRATEVNLYESDTIDVANLSSDFVAEYEDDDNYETQLQSEVYFLKLNQENEDLQNENIRRALDMAYDKEAMTESILKNGSIAAYYLIPGEDFREENGDMNVGDVEKAQELFEKGLEELGKDEITLEYLSYDDDQRKSVAEYIKNQWETNLPGLNITLNQQPNKQKISLEGDLDYDISHSGWRNGIGDPIDFLTLFLSGGSNNLQDFKNDAYDELVNKAQYDFSDNEKRLTDMQEAERILIEEEIAISPMYVASVAKLIRPYVNELATHSNNTETYKWVELDK